MVLQASSAQVFVVSAPSGVGKTTLINKIMPEWPDLCFSVSATTRSPRPGEAHGKDYLFWGREEFIRGIQEGRFLEWAHVHGEYYGTDGRQIEGWLAQSRDVLLDIDVQGARQIRCTLPWARTIFILPPSMDVLQQRLHKRATETVEQLAKRLAAAHREIQEAAWYDFIIVNDDLQEAAADFNAILRACHCHRAAQPSRLKPFLQSSIHSETD